MPKIKEIVEYLEAWAPPSYQEDYDNAGLITGDSNAHLSGILLSLDCIEEIVDEAIKKKCNMIIAHHPIVFRGLKKLTGKSYIERTVIKAIKNDIAIYAIHTNLDHILSGVNHKIAQLMGLENTRVLRPNNNTLSKLTTFIPVENTEEVMYAIHQAGAGMIGNYHHCSFRVAGTGTFMPMEDANPTIGSIGNLEKVEENRMEVIFPSHQKNYILNALFKAHPYEEVAYYVHDLQNIDLQTGAGMIGELKESMQAEAFLNHLKNRFKISFIRHTNLVRDRVKKIALCGGAGSFLLKDAIGQEADVFVSGDFKYHEFFDAENKIIIADIGHYESEQFTKELIYDKLTEKFANIALHFTEVNTNPIKYA